MRFIRRNVIALVALVLAMTGTGLAAGRYLIVARYVRVRLYNNGEAAKLVDPPSSIEMSAWLTG